MRLTKVEVEAGLNTDVYLSHRNQISYEFWVLDPIRQFIKYMKDHQKSKKRKTKRRKQNAG
jgi:hypothetical protein